MCTVCHSALHSRWVLMKQGDVLATGSVQIDASKPVDWVLMHGWVPGKDTSQPKQRHGKAKPRQAQENDVLADMREEFEKNNGKENTL
jgi:hypothetical protein